MITTTNDTINAVQNYLKENAGSYIMEIVIEHSGAGSAYNGTITFNDMHEIVTTGITYGPGTVEGIGGLERILQLAGDMTNAIERAKKCTNDRYIWAR